MNLSKVALLALLFSLTVLTAVSVYKAHGIELLLVAEEHVIMTQVTTTWLSGGMTVTVTTTRAEGESMEAFAARHRAAVDEMLEQFPKDA